MREDVSATAWVCGPPQIRAVASIIRAPRRHVQIDVACTGPGCNADGNRCNRVSPDRKLLNTNGWCEVRFVFASISRQTFATDIFIRCHWKSTQYPVLYRRSNSGAITEYFETVRRKRFVKYGYTPDGRTKLMQQCRADALFDISTSPESGKMRRVAFGFVSTLLAQLAACHRAKANVPAGSVAHKLTGWPGNS